MSHSRRLFWLTLSPLLCSGCGCDWLMDGEGGSGCARRIRIEVDWSAYADERPGGMSLILYEDGSNVPTLISSNETSHILLTLEAGTYHMAVINYSPDEFRNLLFVDMDSMATARLTTRQVSNPWFKPSRTAETVREQPETFGFDAVTYLEVHDGLFATAEIPTLSVLQPVVVTQEVEVVVPVRGLNYLSDLKGALSGMAEGYYPTWLHPTAETTTYLTEEWTLRRSATDKNCGTLTAVLTTFGRPYGHNGRADEVSLSLLATRSDGATAMHEQWVGDRFERLSSSRLRVTLGDSLYIEAPASALPGSNTSGFDADVSDWNAPTDWDFDL